jgi:hypothetical protein
MAHGRLSAALVSTLVVLALAAASPAPGAADPKPNPEGDEKKLEQSGPTAGKPAPKPQEPRTEVPVYKPPKPTRGSFPRNLTGAATRGRGSADAPLVLALAPDHLGQTVNAQPNLYWYLDRDSETRVDFTLIDEESVSPLLEITMAGPLHGGVHAVRLADHGISLEPGRWYEWSVAVVAGGRDAAEDRISRGFITRVPMPPGLPQQLEERGPEQAVNLLAESGLWYDAITTLSLAIDTDQPEPPLRQARAALLDQVGLEPVADRDRGAGP